jgi:hypothetical protein
MILLEVAIKNQVLIYQETADYGIEITAKNKGLVSRIRDTARILKDNCKHRITSKGTLTDGQWIMEVFVPIEAEETDTIGIEAKIVFTTLPRVSYVTINMLRKKNSELAY